MVVFQYKLTYYSPLRKRLAWTPRLLDHAGGRLLDLPERGEKGGRRREKGRKRERGKKGGKDAPSSSPLST